MGQNIPVPLPLIEVIPDSITITDLMAQQTSLRNFNGLHIRIEVIMTDVRN
jgi:hypothetical protein